MPGGRKAAGKRGRRTGTPPGWSSYVHVVKSLNTAAIEVLADPSLVGPATVFVSGDDEAAKANRVR